METESEPRIVAYGGDSITIAGILNEDQQKVLASLGVGAYWIRVNDGKLEIMPSWQELPDPIQDKEMLPFWREHTTAEMERTQLKLFKMEELSVNDCPSISIQHICAYSYSPENYKFQASRLKSYGFQCMRSRRGPDAMYWEIWFLPGLWSAKGDLKEKIYSLVQKNQTKKALKIALDFLAHNVSFGTLDVSLQRMCTVID